MVNLTSFASVSVMVHVEEEEEISITKQMYGWSKYGGANHGLVKTDNNIWYCQCCGEQQAKGLSNYMYGVGSREFIRLCSKCWFKVRSLPTSPTKIREKILRSRSIFNSIDMDNLFQG